MIKLGDAPCQNRLRRIVEGAEFALERLAPGSSALTGVVPRTTIQPSEREPKRHVFPVMRKNFLMPKIEKDEFLDRIEKARAQMERQGLNALMVYGDEYRKENLRYFCNFWPIFERAAVLIPTQGEPVLASAAEGEEYAREMSVWPTIRNVKEFAAVTVPEEIDYPLAKFTPLGDLLKDALGGGKRLGLIGWHDLPAVIMGRIRDACPGVELVEADAIAQQMRIIKSDAEIACLKEAGRLACIGYKELLKVAVPGNTELQAAGAAEGAARAAGAEDINFSVIGSGERTNTVIGRPVDKIIGEGEMVMAAIAVQYEGYVATIEMPFAASKASPEAQRLIDTLWDASRVGVEKIRAGTPMRDMVKAVRNLFRERGLDRYDIYPPLHGIGLAEAESPYPDEATQEPFKAGMTVNTDVSLFGHPAGSNRIEEGFAIREDGLEPLTPLEDMRQAE